MSHLSRGGDGGRLGDMLIQVKYSWTDENELNVGIRATCTQPMITNITSYCPMNLAGHVRHIVVSDVLFLWVIKFAIWHRVRDLKN